MNQCTLSGFNASMQQKSKARTFLSGCSLPVKCTVIKVAFLLFMSGVSVLSSANSNARITGVMNFLRDRADENSLSIFSRGMKHHPYFQNYLPNTYKALKTTNLHTLLLSDSAEWKNTVENDLAHLQILLLKNLQNNLDTALFEVYSSLTDSLPGAFEGVEVRADSASCSCPLAYPVSRCPCSSNETKELTSSARLSIMGLFRTSFEYTTIAQLSSRFKEFRLRDLTDFSQTSSFSEALKEIRPDRFSSITDSIHKWRNYLTGDTSGFYLVTMLAAFYCRLDSALDCALKMADTRESFESRINNAFFVTGFISQICGDAMDLSSGAFSDFRRYALFLARIADVESEHEVTACFSVVSSPREHFQNKREYQCFSISVSSYLGISAGIESGNGTYKRDWSSEKVDRFVFGGLATPTGIELSKGWACGWSTGLFFPIIDIGPAVNTILFNGNSGYPGKLNFTDLLVPGVCLTAGIKDYPVAFGAGWYKGKSIRSDRYGEHHLYCFVGFDVPLLSWRL